MPDSATTVQVTKIVLGEKYMAMLLEGKPLTMSFPPTNPTHQFQIELAPEILAKLSLAKPPQKPDKKREKKSR